MTNAKVKEVWGINFNLIQLHIRGALRKALSMGFSKQEYWSGLPFPSPSVIVLRSKSFLFMQAQAKPFWWNSPSARFFFFFSCPLIGMNCCFSVLPHPAWITQISFHFGVIFMATSLGRLSASLSWPPLNPCSTCVYRKCLVKFSLV